MKCIFEPTGETRERREKQEQQYRCMVCGLTVWTYHTAENIHANCSIGVSPNGVGTEIHKRIKSRGYDIIDDCKCLHRIAALNARGPQWASDNIATIIKWIEEAAKKYKELSYAVSKQYNSLPLWRECVKIQVILPAIRAARQQQFPTEGYTPPNTVKNSR